MRKLIQRLVSTTTLSMPFLSDGLGLALLELGELGPEGVVHGSIGDGEIPK
jgi:hypothetical protein